MKHRIYSFPRMAKGKQIHKQCTEGALGAQATRAEPSEREEAAANTQPPALSTGMRMRNQGRLACSTGVESRSGSSLVQELLKLGIYEGEATEGCLVHGVDEVLITVGEAGFLTQELLVKVAVVCGGFHFGLEGWLHLSLLQQDPVDSLEKGMKSDVSCHSQPLDWLPLEQLLHDVLGLLGDPARIVWRVHPDGLKEFILIITMEGRLTNEHLIEEDPKGPPVHRECVLQALQDFGGDVVRGATEGAGPVLSKYILFAHPKISYLDVAISVQHHIVQLEVPVNDTFAV